MATDFSSFLAEGAKIPEGSALRASTSETVIPEWYTNYGMDLVNAQNAVSQRPYETYAGPRVAGFSPAQQQGFAQTGAAAGAYQPGLTAATEATRGLLGRNAFGTASPYFAQAGGLSATGAARPYLNAAGQSSVANIGQYMNPYQNAVVNRIGELGARNLTENILPGVEGRYIAAGQLGYGGRQPGGGTPSGMMTDTARAIRGTQEATLAEQNAALQSGYTQAAGLANTDLSRQADIGKTYGALTIDQMNALTNLGTNAGSLAGADITRQLATAGQLGTMAGDAQTYGLRGAGALTAVGEQQRGLAQQNIDVAYQDFLREQGYTQEQIDRALTTFKGVASAVPTGTSVYGIEPSNSTQQYKPSTAATVGGLALAAADLFGNKP